ncbi:hypothetical protein [Salinithrix halophila]|uniref:Uncharacterized protein n=1 Tax=Salinithrix halophila TaxID=1485204 RepID=A0ABV8JD71_9BACL
MVASHNITYSEYERSIDKQVQVEEAREEDYRKAKQLASEAGAE